MRPPRIPLLGSLQKIRVVTNGASATTTKTTTIFIGTNTMLIYYLQ